MSRAASAPRLAGLLELLGRWLPAARDQPDTEWEGRGIQPEQWERRIEALREVERRRSIRFVGPVLDALSNALAPTPEPSPALRRALELSEDVVALSRRGRSDRANSMADALREATSRLAGDETCRVRLRLPVDGLVVAAHQRLLVVAELGLRHGLLASAHRVVDACIAEDGGLVHLHVGFGEPASDPWLHHLYLGLLLAAVAPLDGAVLVHGGGVEVRLDRFTLADELLPAGAAR